MIKANISKIMKQQDVVNSLELMPADRIVVPKKDLTLIQHHAVFLGHDLKGESWIAENVIDKGVTFIKATDFFKDSQEITRVERFSGNYYQRKEAVDRAISLRGKSYSLFGFNCEHYSNIVQKNTLKSGQVNVFLALLVLVFLFLFFWKRNNSIFNYNI